MRAFIAIDLGDEARASLAELMATMKKSVPDYKWVEPGSMHLTMRFLDEITQEDADKICEGLKDGVDAGGPLTLKPIGLGAFPGITSARVLFTGLDGDLGRLYKLFGNLTARLEALGLPSEDRAFAPHLTLARAPKDKRPANLGTLKNLFGHYLGPAFEAKELVLYQSTLTPQGPVHKALQSFCIL